MQLLAYCMRVGEESFWPFHPKFLCCHHDFVLKIFFLGHVKLGIWTILLYWRVRILIEILFLHVVITKGLVQSLVASYWDKCSFLLTVWGWKKSHSDLSTLNSYVAIMILYWKFCSWGMSNFLFELSYYVEGFEFWLGFYFYMSL